MQAAQAQLQLACTTHTGPVGLNHHCMVDDRAGSNDRANGISDEGLYGKNRNVRRKYDDDEDVMG